MAEAHLVVGCALILANAVAFAVGGIAWIRAQASVSFWYLLRVAQVTVFLQALLGGLLVFTGREPDGDLHLVYGLLPLLVSFLAEGARSGAAEREVRDLDMESLPAAAQQQVALAIVRREMGIMAVSCGVILFLGLRAAGTSAEF